MILRRVLLTAAGAVLLAASGGATSPALDAPVPVTWGELKNASGGAGTLQKSGGCNGCADAGSVGRDALDLAAGAFEFTPAAGHRLYAGLTDTTGVLPTPATLPFAFSIWPDGGWDIRERGTYKAEGRFTAGDVFRIEVIGGAVSYLQNGRVVFRSAATGVPGLRAGVTLYSKDASVAGAGLAGSGAAVLTYGAPSDRETRLEPMLPVPGTAGTTLPDAAFGTTITRITDAATRPGRPGYSFRTPSGTHQHAWSARGSYFYVVSNDGTLLPYRFDARTGTASRIEPSTTGAGGLTLRFFNEAQFSYVRDNVIYATFNGSGSTLRTIDQYDFSTGAYSRLLDLDAVVPGLAGTLVGGIGSSAGDVERILAFFGGSRQDRHHYAVIFEKTAPERRRLLDTLASTIDGTATATPLGFRLHHATIDRSGRYAILYPTAADMAAPRLAAHVYVWDTVTDVITPLGAAANPNGHDAPGYATLVNQDCCTATTWDAAQWQRRSLASPTTTHDLINPVLWPKHVYLADHPSWHNARPDTLAPFVSALYRYGGESSAWRAWDDEIVAVQTDVGAGAAGTVWRLAHHRSDVAHDTDASRIYFWYTPRPQVSPDGRWVLFTSNWEKTLGSDPAAEAGGAFRQDVFLLRAR